VKTADQLNSEAARYTTTITRVLTDRIAELETHHDARKAVRADEETFIAALIKLREERRDIVAEAIRRAFLDGVAAAKEAGRRWLPHGGECACVDCDCSCHNDGATWDHEEAGCHCHSCDCACHGERDS